MPTTSFPGQKKPFELSDYRLSRYIESWVRSGEKPTDTVEYELSNLLKNGQPLDPIGRAGLLIPWAVQAQRSTMGTGNSGALVQSKRTDISAFQQAIYPHSLLAKLGMTSVEIGFAESYAIPEFSEQGQASFVSEGYDASATVSKIDLALAKPKTIIARTDLTSLFQRQLPDAELPLREELNRSIASAIEREFLVGDSTAFESPVGLINRDDVHIIDAQNSILTQGILNDARRKLSDTCSQIHAVLSPNLACDLAETEIATGTGKMAFEFSHQGLTERNLLNFLEPFEADNCNFGRLFPGVSSNSGYHAGITSHMPDSALILGDFSRLKVAIWEGLELLRNPYATTFQSGGVSLRAMAACDLMVHQPMKSFVVIKNIAVSQP